jgi:hypothetical protein
LVDTHIEMIRSLKVLAALAFAGGSAQTELFVQFFGVDAQSVMIPVSYGDAFSNQFRFDLFNPNTTATGNPCVTAENATANSC